MTDKQLIKLAKDLIAIESTTGNAEGLRDAYNFMIRMIRSSGKNITIEEFESNGKPSLLAYFGDTRPAKFHIILGGHLDVVPGKPRQYKAAVKDDKLYGRGVYDMKAACVVLADLFCEYVDKVPFPLGLQLVTDEETGGYDGVRYQIEQGVSSSFVICAECGRRTHEYEIANEAKGIVVADIGLRGNSAHGAYPWRGDNAATKASQFIQALHSHYPAPVEEYADTTMTVTSISALGGSHTRIPDFATVRLDVRYVPGDPHFKSPKHFKALIKEIDPNAEVDDILVFDKPLFSSQDNPLLQMLKASAEKVEGKPFKFVRRHATSDGRHFGDVGDQACEFGIAGEDQHGDNEHITLQAFTNFRETMRDFLAQAAAAESYEAVVGHSSKSHDTLPASV